MNKPISAGDLVVVVRGTTCCNNHTALGSVFRVRELVGGYGRCIHCNHREDRLEAHDGGGWYYSLSRLKRIPPLEELEGQRTEEKIHEPA